MIAFPNAKINIGLRVTGLRSDGFRNLESCFYPVNWCDALEIILAQTTQFTSSGLDIPGDSINNLCLKAYKLLQQDFDLQPVHIHLHKNIPIGAGMGGGSADAAFTLKLLNDLFELKIAVPELENYARKLGSDCAFFIQNKPVFAIEKGDVFEPLAIDLTNYKVVVIYPDLHITTAEAYQTVVPQVPAENLKKLLQQPLATWKDHVQNDFEKALFLKYPVLPQLKEYLYQAGALYASMTGSGSAVFGIFSPDFTGPLLVPNATYAVWQGSL
ncbi:4-(cytidine 5'-diphospho)-2-C-methyl-D-erythritol kinase [Adhaeribacter pallidiroseus]|uniref:4-diphosphocytidyl-2-C-methyl-D-erythritol kinase n=1 Tax=Adhaeribacter pallidiroseus TaxID=2072847 RepID=A0A369QF59_9BACT|nr:4-(cytidine 5'-diphospho)-2-C-methyl-D-erythritol kinase [Adhaeribacter pallidiroseus]RDC61529.1 4-(cytidine 5'-diphospho)-2-C-methyl-D-erythritol kinase [Adhaeribacter pallidiroseus]